MQAGKLQNSSPSAEGQARFVKQSREAADTNRTGASSATMNMELDNIPKANKVDAIYIDIESATPTCAQKAHPDCQTTAPRLVRNRALKRRRMEKKIDEVLSWILREPTEFEREIMEKRNNVRVQSEQGVTRRTLDRDLATQPKLRFEHVNDANDLTSVSHCDQTEELPAGWTRMRSATTGIMYYFHAETRTSQWERPKAIDVDEARSSNEDSMLSMDPDCQIISAEGPSGCHKGIHLRSVKAAPKDFRSAEGLPRSCEEANFITPSFEATRAEESGGISLKVKQELKVGPGVCDADGDETAKGEGCVDETKEEADCEILAVKLKTKKSKGQVVKNEQLPDDEAKLEGGLNSDDSPD
eukprot:gnl/TRDRNA2_/TRDRNA2_172552_c2_seq1.p1 gnl/TRDRNA2_/TRDRNA2_172552_c2~~gnl/TRDRNA2_/TRDRNA2_172552_c2_seq1.p1  ORF type:complete len:368 (+),score=82.10 gnl/TRDRNA2_/TRDRNA2_172552_c2_seq1:35-1105(+)